MKFLTERTEIAKAINIDHIPVITFDIMKEMEGYPNCYEGTKVVIEGAFTGRYANLTVETTPHIWSNDLEGVATFAPWMCKRIDLSTHATCLHSDFGIHDIEEMIKWNNAPRVHAEDKVLVYFKVNDRAYLRMMKVGKRIDPHCMTATYLEDIDEEG